MKRRPGQPNAPILNKLIISRMVLVAVCMGVLALSFYAFFAARHGHEYARTIVFCALVVMQWANAFNARSDYQSLFTRLKVINVKFYIGLAIAVTLQALVLVGPLQSLLHVTEVSLHDLTVTGIAAFTLPIILVEIHKFFSRCFRD